MVRSSGLNDCFLKAYEEDSCLTNHIFGIKAVESSQVVGFSAFLLVRASPTRRFGRDLSARRREGAEK